MSEKTPEQMLAEHNAKIQEDMWLRRERIELRKLALEMTRSLNLPSASQALEEADKIYDWLIKVL